MTDKFLEFTISGSYYNSKKEIIDFEKVKGKIPYCDEVDTVNTGGATKIIKLGSYSPSSVSNGPMGQVG
jgi:hypothetical protein